MIIDMLIYKQQSLLQPQLNDDDKGHNFAHQVT